MIGLQDGKAISSTTFKGLPLAHRKHQLTLTGEVRRPFLLVLP